MKKLLFSILFIYSNYLFACELSAGGVTANYSPGNVVVQRDLPVGAVITNTSQLPLPSVVSFYDHGEGCYFSSLIDYNGGEASGFAHVYKTNVPGVGISVFNADDSGYFLYSYGENPAALYGNVFHNAPDYVHTISSISLVKIGNITSGALSEGEIEIVKINDQSGTTPVNVAYRVNLTGIANISVLACSVTSGGGLSFPIGNVPADQFTAIGTVSQQTSTQNLGLNCDAGANINVTLNGTQNPDSSDASILALSAGANIATGVGVQLLYNGKPLQLNQMLNLKTSSGGQESFPITARYIQTRDKVTAGVANATATLNIIYQ